MFMLLLYTWVLLMASYLPQQKDTAFIKQITGMGEQLFVSQAWSALAFIQTALWFVLDDGICDTDWVFAQNTNLQARLAFWQCNAVSNYTPNTPTINFI